jgi:hypothetical protein
MIKIFFAIPLVFLIGCASVNQGYVKADRTTYQAIAPEYMRYVAKDGILDSIQKEVRFNCVKSWDERIQAAEASQ